MKIHAEVSDSSGLSKKENAVLKLLSEGLSYQQIADYLSRSIRTVESHTGHILEKLGADNSRQAVSIAIAKGFVSVSLKSVSLLLVASIAMQAPKGMAATIDQGQQVERSRRTRTRRDSLLGDMWLGE